MNYRIQYTVAPDPGFDTIASVLIAGPDGYLPSFAEKAALASQVEAMATWCKEQFGDPFLGTGHWLTEAMLWRRIGHNFLLRDEETARAFMVRWTP